MDISPDHWIYRQYDYYLDEQADLDLQHDSSPLRPYERCLARSSHEQCGDASTLVLPVESYEIVPLEDVQRFLKNAAIDHLRIAPLNMTGRHIYSRVFELGWVHREPRKLCEAGCHAIHWWIMLPDNCEKADHSCLSHLSRCSDFTDYLYRPKRAHAHEWYQRLLSTPAVPPTIRTPHPDPEIERQVRFFFGTPEPYVPLWKKPR